MKLAPYMTVNGKVSTQSFPSIGEALNVLQHKPEGWKQGSFSLRSEDIDPSFFGRETFAEALVLARTGWAEGLKLVQEARKRIDIPVGLRGDSMSVLMADEGDEVLVDRFLDGEDDHWLSFSMREQPRGRIARIRSNFGCSSSFTTDQIKHRGAFVAALVDAMESAGIRCEVVACKRSDGEVSGYAHRIEFLLKKAEDPVDPDKLAFWLVHPAVLRRLGFRSVEMSPFRQQIGSGYGHSTDFKTGGEDEIYIPKMYSSSGEQKIVEAAIKEALKWIEVDPAN